MRFRTLFPVLIAGLLAAGLHAQQPADPAGDEDFQKLLLSDETVRRGVSLDPVVPTALGGAVAVKAVREVWLRFDPKKARLLINRSLQRDTDLGMGKNANAVAEEVVQLGWTFALSMMKNTFREGLRDGKAVQLALEDSLAPAGLAGQASSAGLKTLLPEVLVIRTCRDMMTKLAPIALAAVVSNCLDHAVGMFRAKEASWGKLRRDLLGEGVGILKGCFAERWPEIAMGVASALLGIAIGACVGGPPGSIVGGLAGLLIELTARSLKACLESHLEQAPRARYRRAMETRAHDILSARKTAGTTAAFVRQMDAGKIESERGPLGQAIFDYDEAFFQLRNYYRDDLRKHMAAIEALFQSACRVPDQYLVERIVTLALAEDFPLVPGEAIDDLPAAFEKGLPTYVREGTPQRTRGPRSVSGKLQLTGRLHDFWNQAMQLGGVRTGSPRSFDSLLRELNGRIDLREGWLGWEGETDFLGWTAADLREHAAHEAVRELREIVAMHRRVNAMLRQRSDLRQDARKLLAWLWRQVLWAEEHGEKVDTASRMKIEESARKASDPLGSDEGWYGIYMLSKREQVFLAHVEAARNVLAALPARRRIDESYEDLVEGRKGIEATSIHPHLQAVAAQVSVEALMEAIGTSASPLSAKPRLLALLRAYYLREIPRGLAELRQQMRGEAPSGGTRPAAHAHWERYRVLQHQVAQLARFGDPEALRVLSGAAEPIQNLEAPIVPATSSGAASRETLLALLADARKARAGPRAGSLATALALLGPGDPEVASALLTGPTTYEAIFVLPHRLPKGPVYRDFLVGMLERGLQCVDGTIEPGDPALLSNVIAGLHATYGESNPVVTEALGKAVRTLLVLRVAFLEDWTGDRGDPRAVSMARASRLRDLLGLAEEDSSPREFGAPPRPSALRTATEDVVRAGELPPAVTRSDGFQIALARAFQDWIHGRIAPDHPPTARQAMVLLRHWSRDSSAACSEKARKAVGSFLHDHVGWMNRLEPEDMATRAVHSAYLARLCDYHPRDDALKARLRELAGSEGWLREEAGKSLAAGSPWEAAADLRRARDSGVPLADCIRLFDICRGKLGEQRALRELLRPEGGDPDKDRVVAILRAICFPPGARKPREDSPEFFAPLVELVANLARGAQTPDREKMLALSLSALEHDERARRAVWRALQPVPESAGLRERLLKERRWPAAERLRESATEPQFGDLPRRGQ